ncbi:MAG: amidohydrolase [Anaerolineales bacterium]|nr:amidohydrolase [Anaerolineales bacterium]
MSTKQTLFTNAIVYTVDPKDTILTNAAVLVEGSRIAAIGPSEQLRNQYPQAEIVDVTDRAILPGFVNTHIHLSMTMTRSIADDIEAAKWLPVVWAMESNLKPETVYAGAVLGIAEMIASGTTTFNDHYFMMDEVARAVQETGIRADLAFAILENRNKKKGEKDLATGEAFAAEWNGKAEGRIRTRMGPHALYTCSTELVQAARAAADRVGVGMHMHVAESAFEMTLVGKKAAGPTSIQHLAALDILRSDFVIAHGLNADARDIEILAELGVGIAHCPQAYAHIGGWPWPHIDEWAAAGVAVGLATDGTASNNNLDMFDEMRLATEVRKLQARDGTLLPARQMLRMATIEGAKVLGLQDEIGSIEVGKKADLIFINTRQPHLRPLHNLPSHLVYSARGADVESVMVDGNFLYKDRQHLTLDVNAAMERADREFAAMLGRGGWSVTMQEPKAGLAAALKLGVTQQALSVMQVLVGSEQASEDTIL